MYTKNFKNLNQPLGGEAGPWWENGTLVKQNLRVCKELYPASAYTADCFLSASPFYREVYRELWLPQVTAAVSWLSFPASLVGLSLWYKSLSLFQGNFYILPLPPMADILNLGQDFLWQPMPTGRVKSLQKSELRHHWLLRMLVSHAEEFSISWSQFDDTLKFEFLFDSSVCITGLRHLKF